jgi:hypothetical protein
MKTVLFQRGCIHPTTICPVIRGRSFRILAPQLSCPLTPTAVFTLLLLLFPSSTQGVLDGKSLYIFEQLCGVEPSSSGDLDRGFCPTHSLISGEVAICITTNPSKGVENECIFQFLIWDVLVVCERGGPPGTVVKLIVEHGV